MHPSYLYHDGEPEISVVVPLYNEEENVADLHRRLAAAADGMRNPYEILFVNDGKRDATPSHDRQAATPTIHTRWSSTSAGTSATSRLFRPGLTMRWGRAISGNGRRSSGSARKSSHQFVAAAGVERIDVVYAVRQKRKESALQTTRLFHLLPAAASQLVISRSRFDSGDFCLMDRRVVDALRESA